MKIHFINRLAWVAVLASVSLSANSAMIRVSQESSAGANDFDSNILGSITAFDSTLTAAQYYGYSTTFGASFNDGAQDVTLTANNSHVFFVDGSDGLSAFFVHDKPGDGVGGGGAAMTVNLSGDTADVRVRDDPGEGITDTGGAGTEFVTAHGWIACCTDGFVLGSLDDDWSLLARFDSRGDVIVPAGTFSWTNFAGWLALGDGGNLDLSGDIGRRVRFDLAPIPVPAAVWLFGTALVGFVGIARRRKLA